VPRSGPERPVAPRRQRSWWARLLRR
jgi:hypothetical protein